MVRKLQRMRTRSSKVKKEEEASDDKEGNGKEKKEEHNHKKKDGGREIESGPLRGETTLLRRGRRSKQENRDKEPFVPNSSKWGGHWVRRPQKVEIKLCWGFGK